MKNDYMAFHFHHPFLKKQDVAFSNPVEVIQTDRHDQVLSCLREIEKWTAKGYYAAGYVSYEAAPAFHPAFQVHPEPEWPLIYFGIYHDSEPPLSAGKNDLAGNRTGADDDLWAADRGSSDFTYERHASDSGQTLSAKKRGEGGELSWLPDTGREDYERAIETIHEQIAAGNTYQVNYTVRLSAKQPGKDSYAWFQQLMASQQADYCAYLHFGSKSILSVSPECFFAWNGTRIMTRPMKGTCPRGLSYKDDTEKKRSLRNSAKDQSENVMIVDLLRNDLGRIAKTGTVQVNKLFDIETYPTVYQMTSTIEAETWEGVTLTDIFKALFPCGSVTGAPKVSTMSLIRRLETSPREVYCGAIGYVEPGNHAVFNVPIRTVLIDEQNRSAVYGAGGGITWDSTAKGEYDEMLAKAKVLWPDSVRPDFDLLESLRMENGRIFLMDRHLSRLMRSAAYFRYPVDEHSIRKALHRAADKAPRGLYKIRLLVDSVGKVSVETKPIKDIEDGQEVALAARPVSRQDLFLYHKTTHRDVYRAHARSGSFDTLLWNEDGHVTEFTNGNVVCRIGARLFTPPVKDGLLAGTFRETIVGSGMAAVRSLSIQDVKNADAVWFMNSVRGWVRVNLTEDG